MGKLIGLPGIAGGEIDDVRFFRTAAGAFRELLERRGTIAAGDHGAITVYIDDDGMYRCAFHRYIATQSEITVKTKKAVREWLHEWLPVMFSGTRKGSSND